MILASILLISLIAVFTFYQIHSLEEVDNIDTQFSGIIINKYRTHYVVGCIVVLGKNGLDTVAGLYIDGDTLSDVFTYSNLGDTLIKRKGEKVILMKNAKVTRVFKYPVMRYN